MTLSLKTCWTGLITAMVLAGTCLAFGQEGDPDSYTLESITVTADKRAENIQKVPAAITAFTATELEDAGAKTISDVIEMVPGLSLDHWTSSWQSVNYRGIGMSVFTGKNPVVIYVDGIPLDDRTDYNSDLLNVERVEFLRGPQGTLYGKNAIGGVINIISKKPDNAVSGKISGEIGENATYGVKGVVNSPLIKDKLFMTLSAGHNESDGYMTNDAPGENTYDYIEEKHAKAQLRWLPADGLEINFQGGVDQSRNGVGPMVSSMDEVVYHEYRNPDNKNDADAFDSALNINYSLGFGEFISTTTYRKKKSDFKEYLTDLSSGRVADLENRTFTQEFRLQSPDKASGLKWTLGLYYADENVMANEFGRTINMNSVLGYSLRRDWPYDQDETTMAAFGQATIPLFANVNFLAGLRYEKDKKALNYTGVTTRMDTNQRVSQAEWYDEDDWDALLPKGVLSWNVTPDAMLYASVAKGYLAGGYNKMTTGTDIEDAKFDEETSINYELGAKTTWLDNRLSLNACLFYVDIEDMHVFSQPMPGVMIASNAAKAHSQGIELEARARPFEGMDINASFAWTQAEFDEYGAFTGKTPTSTPDYSFSMSAQYRHSTGVYIRGEMRGFGKIYYDEANTIERDHLELFNAKVGYERDSFDFYVYVNNLTDEKYFSGMSPQCIMVGAPRTMGVMTSIRF